MSSKVWSGGFSIFTTAADGTISKITICDKDYTTLNSFKEYIATRYTNGNPVIVVYQLKTPTAETVQEQTITNQRGPTVFEITKASLNNLSLQVDYKDVEDTLDYLSFTATAANSSIKIKNVGSPTAINVKYSWNRSVWFLYTIGDNISIPNGDTVYLATSDNIVRTRLSNSGSNYYQFVMTGTINSDGNIMSLLDKSCASSTVGTRCFFNLFRDCTVLKKPPKLPAMTLGTYCYYQMFYNTGITTAPVLPALIMNDYCYASMFYACKFTVGPSLPSTELATRCYSYMFTNCTNMTTPPELPATVLKQECYQQMFYQCYGLTSFPRLQFTTMATGCFTYMFQSCSYITAYHLSSLNASGNTFYGNSRCTSLTIDAVEPPTIGSNTITGLKSDCIIYVPAESVDAYKAKQYWSARASYIQAIPSV